MSWVVDVKVGNGIMQGLHSWVARVEWEKRRMVEYKIWYPLHIYLLKDDLDEGICTKVVRMMEDDHPTPPSGLTDSFY